ncbi:fluoride efflux transporter CrcB [Georgenia sp. 10Sc9-8]|uniref:Fluoride-specific ion channel FluC n=1 Tax=Georgenia halotolerans TaxID=3028317 RepID=A0ABT5TZC6_9MICO|nr:fluoride efflux transporter CrcB [Georgenia halotolerans]
MTVILVALGGAAGALLRYYTDRVVQGRRGGVLPWGTLIVNVLGSLVLGVLVGAATVAGLPESVLLVAGVGLCGALTTYSTFGYETLRLTESGARLYAGVNVLLNLVLGLGAAGLGLALSACLWG